MNATRRLVPSGIMEEAEKIAEKAIIDHSVALMPTEAGHVAQKVVEALAEEGYICPFRLRGFDPEEPSLDAATQTIAIEAYTSEYPICWEYYPEIGENDWYRVLVEQENIADSLCPPNSMRLRALEYLKQRVSDSKEDDN